ncbi:hypothetical protein A5661_03660 [Mycobacterium asiaticum]|nr:hypothetical protein A5661_03660 [Mycobacterium asiaticum]
MAADVERRAGVTLGEARRGEARRGEATLDEEGERRYLEVDRAWRDHLLVGLTVEEVYGSVASSLVRAGRASWV